MVNDSLFIDAGAKTATNQQEWVKIVAEILRRNNILQKDTREITFHCNSGGITGVEAKQRFK